jgi:hypothetical protein
MAIDIRQITLNEAQKRHIARLAEQSGKSWNEIIDEKILATDEAMPLDRHTAFPDQYIEDNETWLKYFEKWASQRKSYNPHFDDSRESIYSDRI